VTSLIQKDLVALLSKKDQTLTLNKSYEVWHVPPQLQGNYPQFNFVGEYLTRHHLNAPLLGATRTVVEALHHRFVTTHVNSGGFTVNTSEHYPSTATLEEHNLTLADKKLLSIGSVTYYAVYTLGV